MSAEALSFVIRPVGAAPALGHRRYNSHRDCRQHRALFTANANSKAKFNGSGGVIDAPEMLLPSFVIGLTKSINNDELLKEKCN